MKRLSIIGLFLLVAIGIAACDTPFQNNPHGPTYVDQITPITTVPVVATTKPTITLHLSPFGLGASLQAIVAQYGQPTKYTVPPLYAFQDGGDSAWPKGSLIIVTMKEDRAVEFSYAPGSDHPMTYQEAQDFAVKLLPDDAQGPKTVQQEDNNQGKCLAKTYHSDLLKKIFSPNDFMSPDGKDTNLGSVTVNFYPDAATYSITDSTDYGKYTQQGDGSNHIVSTNRVNSVLINLGDRPSC